MIGVQVGEDDAFHISRPDAKSAQLRTDFLITLDSKCHVPSQIGMQGPAAFEEVGSLARIDHDHTFLMINHPGIRRKPSGPVSVQKHSEPSSQSASASFDLRGLDPDGAGLDRVELQAFATIDRTICGWSKWTMWPALGTRSTVLFGGAMAAGNFVTAETRVSASCSPKT